MKMENGKLKMKLQTKLQNYYDTSPKIVGILISSTLAEGVVLNVDRSSNSTGYFSSGLNIAKVGAMRPKA